MAGYDMQFDIRYAYFNFLQSIPFGSRFSKTEAKDSGSDASKLNLRDQMCPDASAVYALGGTQDTEDE